MGIVMVVLSINDVINSNELNYTKIKLLFN